jgi:hypothetical protein
VLEIIGILQNTLVRFAYPARFGLLGSETKVNLQKETCPEIWGIRASASWLRQE